MRVDKLFTWVSDKNDLDEVFLKISRYKDWGEEWDIMIKIMDV